MALLQAMTKYGIVEGIPSRDPDNTVFKGIPYAKAPLGVLRFAPPQPCDPWEGVRKCDSFGPSAVQYQPWQDKDVTETSEDCLYLNIWTPAGKAGEKLPVMFWVHGGGFVTGTGASPEFEGDAFNKRGVIYITINYRLGALGFLALPELQKRDGVTGNSGLLDQIFALKWVKENIEQFGGDPENISVFGFSAGAMSCRMLISSPLSKDMISKAVLQSGGGINDSDYYRPLSEKMEICQRGMERLNWTLEDIMEKPAQEVFEKLQDATKGDIEGWEKSVFQPSVDGYALLDTPGVTIWKGESADIPVISGSVGGDYGWIRIVDSQIEHPDWRESFIFGRGVSWAQRQADTGRRPIYTYHFERTQPETRWASEKWPSNRKCVHGSDLAYTFGTLYTDPGFTEYDYKLSDMLNHYWANFVKTGNPNGEGLPEWPSYTKEQPVSLHITDEGYCVEELANTPEKKRAIRFTVEHPGLIRDLKGI